MAVETKVSPQETYTIFVLTSEAEERLDNWVKERPLKTPRERIARKVIADAIHEDIEHPNRNISQDEIKKLTALLSEKLSKEQVREVTREDSVTHKPYKVRLEVTDDTLRASEIGEDGEPISVAEITIDGRTRLLLQYSDQRYVARDANPGIINAPNLPKTTAIVFELLVNSIV